MINDIVKYKTSMALFAANELKIFDYLSEHKYFDLSICKKNNWDEDSFVLLCKFLEGRGYLVKDGNQWRLSKEFSISPVRSILEKEIMLYKKWITPNMLVEAVQKGANNRTFSKIHFDLDEQKMYDDVVYGNNLYVIAFYLLKKMKKKILPGNNILEYGRSQGKLSVVIQKHIKTINVYRAAFNEYIASSVKYDFIIIYNSVHYKKSDDWVETVKIMKKKLAPNGVICVIDFFYDNNCDFLSTVLLDWMVCGGIYNVTYKEIVETFESVGFSCFDEIYIKELFLQAIVFN